MRTTYTKLAGRITITAVCLIFSGIAAYSQNQPGTDTIKGIPYFIKIGEGTGGVKLGISTVDDVQKLFGECKIHREKSKRDGKIYSDRALFYKKNGLKFFALDNPVDIIYSIEVSMKGARTEKDIVIGTSTQDDVLKTYGEPSYRSPESLEYDGLGVVFQFNNGLLVKVLLTTKK
ncbi:MAG: hypothetical protein ACLQQ4_04840 [Bacteroidia bacterium]